MTTSFKDANRALQELVREYQFVREHNHSFKEGDDLGRCLLFSEGALVIVILEHFVRIVLGPEATDKDTLHPLLKKAIKADLIRLPWDDQDEGVTKICAVRNTILHGNYAQAAAQAGCSSVEDYFKTQFTPEIDGMYKLVNYILSQIDAETGKPLKGLA